MNKKVIKTVSFIIVMLICMLLLTKSIFASTITKDVLKTNLTSILETAGSTATVDADDSKITFTYSDSTAVEVSYTISDSECSFSITNDYTSSMTEEDYLKCQSNTSSIMKNCFQAVTDASDISSSNASTYYNEKIENGTTTGTSDSSDLVASAKNTKISVSDTVFTYTQTAEVDTDEEYKVTDKLVINMSNISSISSSGGITISTSENNTQVNEINEIGNEIFDENNASIEDIPDTGLERWIALAVVAVAAIIIIILLMNVMNTNKIKKEQ